MRRIVCGTDGTEFGCDWTRRALADAQIGEEARKQIPHRASSAKAAPASSPHPSKRADRLPAERTAVILSS